MTIFENTVNAANQVISSTDLDLETRIVDISSYVELLDTLLTSLQDLDKPAQLSREDLAQLEPLHSQVIAIAVGFLGDTSVELKQLQIKGKAILAYTDTLPKRVSMRSEKRG
jgi:hypothetical protein